MPKITEHQSPFASFTLEATEILYEGKSAYQDIIVADTEQFGRVLVLDGVFQTSVAEEWVYHEMITHIPLSVHPNPKRVLIIGGGDGGAAREVLKHASVEKLELCEIDGEVVRVAKEYFPTIAKALLEEPPALEVHIGDGIAKVQESKDLYDVIIVDCSDPIGPGEGLFTEAFYRDAFAALKEDGVFVQQTESPYFHASLVHDCFRAIQKFFPFTRLYCAAIPLYPSGLHCFTIGSKKVDPLQDGRKIEVGNTRYYNEGIRRSAFVLPNFVKEIIRGAKNEKN